MKIKKIDMLFVLSLLFFIPNLWAQYRAAYQDQLDLEKMIVIFDASVTLQQKNQVLNDCVGVNNWGHLDYPKLTIIQTKATNVATYYELKATLEQVSEVKFVGEYFKNEKGECLGITNQVLVYLRQAEDYAQLEQVAQQYSIKKIQPHRLQQLYELELDKNATKSAVDIAIELHQSKRFVFAEPNYLMNPIVATNDTLYPYQWALENTGSMLQYNGTVDADMDVDSAWTITMGAPHVKIAIIDSGVDTLHPDLAPNLLPGYSANGDGSKGYPSFNNRSDGHGTCCAGIVGAVANNGIGVAGVAPQCKMIPIKLFVYQAVPPFGVVPYSTASWMADAITWAWQVGDADVMSNSWGLTPQFIALLPGPGDTSTVNTAIRQAYTNGRHGKGSLLFFSSGNEGDPAVIWPSKEMGAIAVNATSMCDERKYNGSCDGESWEGNYGVGLELGAPGVKIMTTDALGNNGYQQPSDYMPTFNGTSAACPNAAAVMGLILSIDTTLRVEEARAIIDSTADKVGGYSYTTSAPYGAWSSELGYGRVNAYRAVKAAQQQVVLATTTIDPTKTIQLYPNPTNGRLIIQHNLSMNQPIRLSVYSQLGQLVQQRIINRSRMEVDLQECSNGIYYMHIQTGEQVWTEKVTLIR